MHYQSLAVKRAALNIKGGSWMKSRLAASLAESYGTPQTDTVKVVTNNNGARSFVAPRGRAQGGFNAPMKMAHPERLKLTIDATELYDEANPNQIIYARLFDEACYYKHRINQGLVGINQDVKILVENSEGLYEDSFKGRLCNSTLYLLGVKFKLASSRRPEDANYQSSVAEMPGGLNVHYAHEKKTTSGLMDMDLMEEPNKINNNIGFMDLVDEQKILNRNVTWVPGIYAGQKWHLHLEFAAIEFGY